MQLPYWFHNCRGLKHQIHRPLIWQGLHPVEVLYESASQLVLIFHLQRHDRMSHLLV